MDYNVINIFSILYFTLFIYSTGVDSETPEVSFIPKNYLLHIKTKEEHFKDGDTSKMMFEGDVTVEFDMKKSDNFEDDFQIMLNANPNMIIDSLKLEGKNLMDKYTTIESCKNYTVEDKLFINCTKDINCSTFKLNVLYKTPFGKDMTGFHRSSYKDSSNNTRWLLTTHFEPLYARLAFPCFDQPGLKAKFTIHITVPKDIKTVLTNTERDVVTEEGSSATFFFKQTEIPMSTYLVAFTASNLAPTEPAEFQSDYNEDKFPKRTLRTYGRKEFIDEGDGIFAQKIGIEAINALTKYLNLGYAFEKIDFVGLPDFFAGAMENWGHISFRENALFVNNETSSTMKQYSVLTITHELVHQWFGNLVTLKSWDYIWLNEAFAKYFEYKIASNYEICKTWNLMNQILVNEVHLRAFEVDGINSSKPLNNKITDESLVLPSFNDIPYAKGVAVLRMWDLELKGGLQKSLQEYLLERKEKTTVPGDLFKAFEKNANMNEETFKTWTDQAGYPVVEVQKKNGTYHLIQSRFFWDKMKSSEVWRIPITYSTDCSKDFQTLPSLWLHKEPIEIKIEENCKWIIFNNQQAGYYRVSYDKENWNALSKALLRENHSGIHELNRAQIINDVFSLARSLQKTYVEYSTALSLTKYLAKEQSLIVWKTALNAFDFLQSKIYRVGIYDKFRKYILSLVEPNFKGLNSNAEDHLEKLKNIEIARWACSLDFEPCVKQAKATFNDDSYLKFPDTQEIVLCTVIRNDQKVWDIVFNKYKSEESSALKLMYISSLGCTNSVIQAKVFLNKTLEEKSEIRKQDLLFVLQSVYNGNPNNIEAAFEFIKQNYQKIATEYGGKNPLGKSLFGIAKKFTTKEQVKNLENLADEIENSLKGGDLTTTIENARKIAKSNTDWVQGKMVQLRSYFGAGSIMSYSFSLLLVCLICVFQF